MNIRLIIAEKEIITTSTTIKNIALLAGFNNYSAFHQSFKKKFKISPEEYRQKYRMKATINFKWEGFRIDSLKIIVPNLKDYTFNYIETDFINRIIKEILDNIDNEIFSSTQLAKNLFISISQLNKKLKKLNFPPVARLILNIRLEFARQLLLESNMKVQEIWLEAGFKEKSHFSRVFKKKYKLSPIQYKKKFKMK